MQPPYPQQPQPQQPSYPPPGYPPPQPGYGRPAPYQQVPYGAHQPSYPPASNSFALAGFIQSIIGVFAALVVPGLGFILGVVSCVFGGIGMSRANRTGRGAGMAITALILGPVTIVLSILAGIVWAGINS